MEYLGWPSGAYTTTLPTTVTGTLTSFPTSTWNGPICMVCNERYLGICGNDHTKFLNGYVGAHRG